MFKPQLAPNQQIDLNLLTYPLIGSVKIDGMRMLIKDGELITRSLKPIMSKSLKKRFNFLAEHSKQYKQILDGELYSLSLTFSELSGQCRAFNAPIADDLCFYCFDVLREPLEQGQLPYSARIEDIISQAERINNKYFKVVPTKVANSRKEVEDYFEKVLAQGYEGLILRNPNSGYKFGRTTIRENIMYKVKPFVTEDAQVIGIVQSTEVSETAAKTINELGRSVTSKKVGDRILIEKAAAFTVLYEGKELKVVLAMTDEEKIDVWKNQEKYLGRWIEYKGMLVGAKDVPRHPTFLRMRFDRE